MVEVAVVEVAVVEVAVVEVDRGMSLIGSDCKLFKFVTSMSPNH